MPAGQGSAGDGRDAERFAAALEHGAPPHAVGDAELASDLRIAAMLRDRGPFLDATLSSAFDPTPDAKARAKQRLMAVLAAEPVATTRIQRQDADPTAPMPVVPAQAVVPSVDGEPTAEPPASDVVQLQGRGTIGRSRRRSRHALPGPQGEGPAQSARSIYRRTAFMGAAAAAVLVVVAGGGVFVSRDALPGDDLYAMKRAAESAGFVLTLDDAATAQRHLDLASTRMDEVERMAERPTANIGLLTSALVDFETSTTEGAKILFSQPDSPSNLTALQDWSTHQADRLDTVRPDLPAQVKPEADKAGDLLGRVTDRAAALASRAGCAQVTDGSDDLGPLPARGSCASRMQGEGGPGSTSPMGTPTETGGAGVPTTGSDPVGGEQATPSTSPQGSTPADPTPTGATPTPTEDERGLLPGVGGGLPLGGSPSPAPTTSGGQQGGDGSGEPSLDVPPLLPGLPGITLH